MVEMSGELVMSKTSAWTMDPSKPLAATDQSPFELVNLEATELVEVAELAWNDVKLLIPEH